MHVFGPHTKYVHDFLRILFFICYLCIRNYIWYEAQMRACFFEGFWFLFVIFASETINCT